MKKTFFKFGTLFFISGAMLFGTVGCQKHQDLLTEEVGEVVSPAPVFEEGKLILGEQKENPYSLQNMEKARAIVSQQSDAPQLSALQTPLKATHYYVVFLPETPEHMQVLREIVENRIFVVRHHPMDYEILQYGADYVDSRTKDPQFPVLYASVPVSATMPNVPYEQLEELYLPDDDNEQDEVLEESSLYLVEQKENEKQGVPQTQAFLGIGKKWRPDGFVRVKNSDGQIVPLRNAEIQIYNWFFDTYCHTNDDGYFRSSERFSREMGVYTTWDSHSCKISSDWNEILGIRRSDKIGDIGKPTKDFELNMSNSHIWRKATVHNAVQKFNDYVARNGIGHQVSGENHFWVKDDSFHRGAAPMIGTGGMAVMGLASFGFNDWKSYLGLAATAGNVFIKGSLPDIVINVANYQTEAIDRLVFHESSHLVHAKNVKPVKWGQFVKLTLENINTLPDQDPYGNGTQPSAYSGQKIALYEGWANFLERNMMSHYYPNRAWMYSLESFEMYSTPSNIRNSDWAIENFYRGWFLHGLMWDLVDGIVETNIELRNGANRDDIVRSNGVDNVQISIQQLFNALQSDISTPDDLKNRLKQEIPAQATQIEQLFNAYGY